MLANMIMNLRAVACLLVVLQLRDVLRASDVGGKPRDESMITGYHYGKNTTSMATAGEQKVADIQKFGQFKCDMLYNAHFHLSVAMRLIQLCKSNANILDEINDMAVNAVNYLETAVRTVRQFYGLRGIHSMYEVWLVYDLAYQMYTGYSNDASALRESLRVEPKTAKLLEAHASVVEQLEMYFQSSCDTANLFHMNSASCLHYRRFETKLASKTYSVTDRIRTMVEMLAVNQRILCLTLNKIVLGTAAANDEISQRYLTNVLYGKYNSYDFRVNGFVKDYLGLKDSKVKNDVLTISRRRSPISDPRTGYEQNHRNLVEVFKLITLCIGWTITDTPDVDRRLMVTTFRQLVEALLLTDDSVFGEILVSVQQPNPKRLDKAKHLIENESEAICKSLNLPLLDFATQVRGKFTKGFANQFFHSVYTTLDAKDRDGVISSFHYAIFKSYLDFKAEKVDRSERPSADRSRHNRKTLIMVF